MRSNRAVRRLLRVILGFLLVTAGLILALPGVPGPGLLIALGGLVLLSEEFRWARRVLDWAKRRAAEARRKVTGEGRPR